MAYSIQQKMVAPWCNDMLLSISCSYIHSQNLAAVTFLQLYSFTHLFRRVFSIGYFSKQLAHLLICYQNWFHCSQPRKPPMSIFFFFFFFVGRHYEVKVGPYLIVIIGQNVLNFLPDEFSDMQGVILIENIFTL